MEGRQAAPLDEGDNLRTQSVDGHVGQEKRAGIGPISQSCDGALDIGETFVRRWRCHVSRGG
jgi:hypothetical protein